MQWNQPDYHHERPKLSRKDSLELFTALLDLYSALVHGYDKMIIYRDSNNYSGCSLQQLFDCDGFLSTFSKGMQPFVREFISTQLFSNLVTSRIEVSTFPSSQTIDFPILFFDKYLTFMKQPFQRRYRHLEKVLYQHSNRILLVSIPVEAPKCEIQREVCEKEFEVIRSCVLSSWTCCYGEEMECFKLGEVECTGNEEFDKKLNRLSFLSLPREYRLCTHHTFCPTCNQSLSLIVRFVVLDSK